MASVDCAKYTASAAKSLRVHFDQDERMERRHENPHINKELTHLNYFIGADSYSQMLENQQRIVEETDKKYPPLRIKSDRITVVMMEIPVPKIIADQGKSDAFLSDAYKIIEKLFGKEYCCGMTVHKDEIHDYIDSRKKQTVTSLEHGHAMVVPFATWSDKETVRDEAGKPKRDEHNKIIKRDTVRHSINGKHFLTKPFLQKLQTEMQEMCLYNYGISYQTKEQPLKMTVEELKNESDYAEAVISRAEREAYQIISTVSEQKTQIEENQSIISRQQNENEALAAAQMSLLQEQLRIKKDISKKKAELELHEELVSSQNEILERQKSENTELISSKRNLEAEISDKKGELAYINKEIDSERLKDERIRTVTNKSGKQFTVFDGTEKELRRIFKQARRGENAKEIQEQAQKVLDERDAIIQKAEDYGNSLQWSLDKAGYENELKELRALKVLVDKIYNIALEHGITIITKLIEAFVPNYQHRKAEKDFYRDDVR